MTWWRRVFRQRALERELDAELRDHIDREIADRVRAGESEDGVRREMRLRSGGLDQVKEACRDVRRPPVLADFAADVRFALRVLVRNSWATAGAILTLALAMGVANATFISTYAALWRDFPFERPDRIAIMRTVDARGREAGLSFADYQDWRREARVFDGPSAAFAIGAISLGRDGAAPEQLEGLYVSADTFSVLRVKPQLGRDFSAADDRPGAEAVAIISSNIWKSRYAANRDVLGRKVSVNGTIPATIVGVMPDGIRFIDFTDVWVPLAQMPGLASQRRDTRPLMMIGRLPDDANLDRVRAELRPIAANIAASHPETNKDIRPLVNTLLEAYNGGVTLTESSVFLPLLAATFVLLIAAANLANLLLARAAYRSREIAIRMAIGATQWRIVRGLLIESLVLASVAWVLAVAGSWLALTFSASQVAPHLPYWHLKMDARLLGTLAAIALLTTGLFGLAPAVYASRRATADGLKDGGRLSTPPNVRRWTHALLVGQFAVTLALLNGAGLAAKRFLNFFAVDRNVQTADALTTFIRLPAKTYPTPDQRVAFHEQLKARLLSLPGVTASTVASAAPFSPAGRRQLTSVDGQPTTDPPPDVMTLIVEPSYFQTVVRGLVLGESFSALHGTPGHEAAIVNERFAKIYLGGGSPIGRHLDLRLPTARRTYLREADAPAPPVSVEIVGVSPDVRQALGDDALPTVYLPFRAEAPASVALIVRGSSGSRPLVADVRDAVNAIDPDLALGAVRTLDDLRDRSRSGSADMASQFAKIGLLALVFSGVGLYSAMAYAVRRRTQEIAVRMALGAEAAQVRWLFLKAGAWIITGGVIFGVPTALVVGRLLQNTFVRTESRDPVALIVTVALLAIVALVASIVPAQRATRLEPTVALRIE